MIWIKRFGPFVLIGLLWLGYNWYTQRQDAQQDSDARRLALISARVWVATAIYRTEPNLFLAYRDSVLKANNQTSADMKSYYASLDRDPDRQLQFATYLSKAVDSIAKIEDSLRRASANPQTDSLPPGVVPPKVAHDSLAKLMGKKQGRDSVKAVPIIPQP